MTGYFDALRDAMSLVAAEPNSIFLGQAVQDEGTAMSKTFRHLPREKLLEMPVAEDLQMGIATGLALAGHLPVCCYPRINFLLLATSQLVLHLDKLPMFSEYRPKVIIRTAIPTDQPLDPGPQHVDFTYVHGLNCMLRTVQVAILRTPEQVIQEYKRALAEPHSCLLVERMENY